MTLGDRILKVRKTKKVSQLELAQKLNILPQALLRYEKNIIKNPSYEIVAKICLLFSDINPKWLLTGIGPMTMQELRIRSVTPFEMAEDDEDYGQTGVEKVAKSMEQFAVALKDARLIDYNRLLDGMEERFNLTLKHENEEEKYEVLRKKNEDLEREINEKKAKLRALSNHLDQLLK